MTTQYAGSVKFTPREYQSLGIKGCLSQAALGLLLDPGLGKTSIILATSKVLRGKEMVKGVLVFAPLRAIYDVWPSELKKWADFNGLTYQILHGPKKLEALQTPADMYFMNPEGLPWLIDRLATMKDWPFDMLVVDESTLFKSSATKRFKLLRTVLTKFKRRYILTGTPTPNGLLDLFGQIYILDLGHSLGRYITHYRNEYFYSTGYGGYTWVPRETAMEEITSRIAPLVMRMRAQDWLTLPKLVDDYRWVDLPPAARKLYKQMENDFIVELGDDIVISPSAAAAGGRCRQITNGALYTSADGAWTHIHDAKLDALGDLLAELNGSPLLLAYEFNHDRERIMERFKCPALGHQSPKKDSELIGMFNAGVLPLLIGHPGSVGRALNLQKACAHVGWFGLTWNQEHQDQFIKRVWRQGNDSAVVINHTIAVRDTLDEVVLSTVSAKDAFQTKFLEGVRNFRSA